MRVDLHIHTNASIDSIIHPKELISRAERAGLDAFAITDHSTVNGWKPILEYAERVAVIKGEEVLIVREGRKVGEILALFINEMIPNSDVGEILDRIKEQDGVAVVPHPFDRLRRRLSEEELVEIRRGIDAIEVFNARVVFSRDNKKAFEFARRFNLPMVGGSDAHTPWEVGAAYTVADCSDLEEFRKVLKKGRTRAMGRRTSILFHILTKMVSTKNKLLKRFR